MFFFLIFVDDILRTIFLIVEKKLICWGKKYNGKYKDKVFGFKI